MRPDEDRQPEAPPTAPAPGPQRFSGVLTQLFPPAAGTALTRVGDEQPDCPYPSERAVTAGASGRRRCEFLAGRACAHAALRAIGGDGLPIGRGAMREPLWPSGVVGSISHAGGLAGAVVAPAGAAWGVGLDIEVVGPPLDAAVERLVLSPAELSGTDGARRPDPERAKIAFAAKECVYKCLFPRTRWPLELHDAAIEVDTDRCRYRAVVDERFRHDGVPLPPLQGRFAIVGSHVLAGLWIGPGGPVGERRERAPAAHGISRSGPRKR